MKIWKKAISLFLVATIGLSAAACGNKTAETTQTPSSQAEEATEVAQEAEEEEIVVEEPADASAQATASTENASDTVYRIGIVQLTEHPALNATKDGFLEQLDALGIKYEVNFQNAQNDMSNLKTIAQNFQADNLDLILAIATPAVQIISQEITDVPILATAVTDYEEANIVTSAELPGGNVSGTSDQGPIEEQIQLLFDLKPDTKKVGILYTTSEANSKVQVDAAIDDLKRRGIEAEAVGITSVNDLKQATQTLVDKVDAIWIPTDNTIASSIQTVAEIADNAKVIVVGGEENQVLNGATATYGINYLELGRQTADMAKRILVDGVDVGTMPIETAKTFTYSYNQASVDATGITLPEAVKQGVAY